MKNPVSVKTNLDTFPRHSYKSAVVTTVFDSSGRRKVSIYAAGPDIASGEKRTGPRNWTEVRRQRVKLGDYIFLQSLRGDKAIACWIGVRSAFLLLTPELQHFLREWLDDKIQLKQEDVRYLQKSLKTSVRQVQKFVRKLTTKTRKGIMHNTTRGGSRSK